MELKNWKEQFINYLQEKIKNNQINYESFNEAVKEYKDISFEIQKILEYAYKNATGKDKDKLYKLYLKFSLENAGEMTEKLRIIGWKIKNKKGEYENTEVYERFYDKNKKRPAGISYRIIELTRLGKREEVFGTLLREFQGAYFPSELANAFNPIYPDEIFKIFIYSFLSGILGEQKQGGAEE